MVCVLFNLNKYWARYYKKHFFKKFYTVLIRAPKFISGTCIVRIIHVPEIQNRKPESQTGFSDTIFSPTSDPILVKISRLDSPRPGLSNGG